MTETATHLPFAHVPVTTATVLGASERGVEVRSPALGEAFARLALAGTEYAPRAGDQVLLIVDGEGQAYVVGVLRALREAAPRSVGGIEIEHDAAGGRTRLTLPRGDLELNAETGRVRLHGARGVELSSERDVTIAARERASIGSVAADGSVESGASFEGSTAELRAGVLATKASHLHTLAEDVTLVAARMDVHLERLRQRAAHLETEAGEIVEKAKAAYREVEGLAQTRAGRIRWVARSTLHALAERAKMKAESVFAIDGESIHLG
jgi:hypothetical protein